MTGWRRALGTLVGGSLCACSLVGDDLEPDDVEAPTLARISRDTISVGQRLEFFGDGFDETTRIVFEGQYVTDDGHAEPVALQTKPIRVSSERLVWPYFGPFRVPFSRTGDKLGTFTGTVRAEATGPDGAERSSEPLDVTLTVGPSIIVRRLAPLDVSCAEPSEVLLGGLPLHIEVEAVGISPLEFTFAVQDDPDSPEDAREYTQPAVGQLGSVGHDGELVLAEVPDGLSFHVAQIEIAASDAQGETVSSAYAFGVHRQLQYFSDVPRVAQIEEPRPVSGCNSGGAHGRSLEYEDPDPDLRTRLATTRWDESWVAENDLEFAAEDVLEWGALGKVGGLPVGVEADRWTVAYPRFDHVGAPVGPGQNGFWAISSVDAGRFETGTVPPDAFGVWYRQATRLIRPGYMISWDMCGQPEIVAETTLTDYRWDVDLAVGDACPPFPKPELPAAECVIPPCD